MRLFYRIAIYLTELELAIARSSGRNPASVAILSSDLTDFQGALAKLEIQR